MNHFLRRGPVVDSMLIAAVAIFAAAGCSGTVPPTSVSNAAAEQDPSTTSERDQSPSIAAADSTESSADDTEFNSTDKPARRNKHGRREPLASPVSQSPAVSASDHKLPWEEVEAHLSVIKKCRYRPTRNDWDKGDKHLAEKLTSLLEELNGQEVASRIRLADQILGGGQLNVESTLDASLGKLAVTNLFEKLGQTPTVSDRKVSWEKLEAMLSVMLHNVSRQDWEAGDKQVIARLKDLHTFFRNRELAAMQRNAYLAATNPDAEIELDFSAQSATLKVETILKELHAAGITE